MIPSQEVLREMFDLVDEPNPLVWKVRPENHFKNADVAAAWNGRFPGKRAGTNKDGFYCSVGINGIFYGLHRVVETLLNGPIPEGIEVDHIDGNPGENRPWNLRRSDRYGQMRNQGVRRNNHNRLKGVTKNTHGLGYHARIRGNGQPIYLGTFPTRGEAAVAYAKASIQYHGKFSIYLRKVAA